MVERTEGGVTYTQNFDVENRLTSVVTGEQTTTFVYDAAGQRVKTIKADGTVIYTPFPHYEEELRPQPITIDSSGPATADDAGWQLETPASLGWATTRTFPGTASFSASEHQLNNLADGKSQSLEATVVGDRYYTLKAWVKGELKANAASGQAEIQVATFTNGNGELPVNLIWSSNNLSNETWQQVQGDFYVSAGTNKTARVSLVVNGILGWVAFDDLTLQERDNPSIFVTIPDAGFESAGQPPNNWSLQPDANYPATSLWYGTTGPAAPHGGNYSLALSNLAHSEVSSPFIPISAASQQVSVWAKGEIEGGASAGKVRVLADYYDSSGGLVETALIWEAGDPALVSWQQLSNTSTRPASATQMKVRLVNNYTNGWMAYDNVAVTDGASTSTFDGEQAQATTATRPIR